MSRSDGNTSVTDAPSATVEDRDLRVVLEIERGGPCFIDDIDGDVLDVDVRVAGGTCHTEVTVCESCTPDEPALDAPASHDEPRPDGRPRTQDRPDDDAEDRVVTKYHTDDVCDHCPTAVFATYGCIPHFVRAEHRSFFVKAFLPNSAAVSNLVADLNEIGATVRNSAKRSSWRSTRGTTRLASARRWPHSPGSSTSRRRRSPSGWLVPKET
jgi:hypothetical protein